MPREGLAPTVSGGGRRLFAAGTSREATRYPHRRRIRLVGLGRTLGKRVGGNPSRVRISYPPRTSSGRLHKVVCIDIDTATAAAAERVAPPREARRALALLSTSIGLAALTALLGPSAASPTLPGSGLLPPYSLDVGPSETVVTALLALAVVLGACGLLAGWRALATGWRPDARRMLAVSLLTTAGLCLVPTVGSADIVSYAAYGRMAATGYDPYATTPATLARAGDPVAVNVQGWADATSIYGPLATAEQWLASTIGGRSLRTTVVLLVVFNAFGFAVTTVLLYAACRGPDQRRRAMLMWGLNPLLLFQLVSAAHVDAWSTAFLVAAVVALRRSAFAAGALLGLAVDIKFTLGIVGVALLVALWRDWSRIVVGALGFALTVVPAYLLTSPDVFGQARRASSFVAHANVWQPIALLVDGPGWRQFVTTLAWLSAAALAAVLVRRQRNVSGDVVTRSASAAVAVLAAYVLLTAYVLPWYDAPLWAMLALLPASGLDRVLLVHTTVLSVAYLPGNIQEFASRALHWMQFVVQRVVAPITFAALTWTVLRREPADAAARAVVD